MISNVHLWCPLDPKFMPLQTYYNRSKIKSNEPYKRDAHQQNIEKNNNHDIWPVFEQSASIQLPGTF